MTDEKPAHKGRTDNTPKEVAGVFEARKELAAAFLRVAKNEAGQIVLRHIMQECGFKAPSMIMNPETHEILEYSTIWNESKRGLWLDLRKLIPVKFRNEIEKDQENE